MRPSGPRNSPVDVRMPAIPLIVERSAFVEAGTSLDRRRGRLAAAPRPEPPLVVMRPRGSGLVSSASNGIRCYDADALHRQPVNQELARLLAGPPRNQAQHRVDRLQPIDADR